MSYIDQQTRGEGNDDNDGQLDRYRSGHRIGKHEIGISQQRRR